MDSTTAFPVGAIVPKGYASGAGYMRIWAFYQPKSLGFVLILTALLTSATFPILGYILSKVQFLMLGGIEQENFTENMIFVF